MRQRVFIGSSSEAMDVCRAVQQELERDFEITIWDQDVFRLTYDAIDSLLAELDSSDAGVFVLTPDDLTIKREQSKKTARDNVIFELGLFMGALGRDRTFIVHCSDEKLDLPTNLAGITPSTFSKHSDGNLRAAVSPVCTELKDAVRAVMRKSAENEWT